MGDSVRRMPARSDRAVDAEIEQRLARQRAGGGARFRHVAIANPVDQPVDERPTPGAAV
jgi:hypothetical protein